MSAQPRIGRRALLLGAVGAAVSVVARPPWSWPSLLTPDASPAERLAGLVAHRGSALAVGREYLRAAPAETDTGVLVSLLAESLPGGMRTVERAADGRLRELLHGATREDFDAERTVQVDGWVLARTEARLCGLVAARAERRPV
jgi:hypothetical protein